MITSNLFTDILVTPFQNGASALHIVSGYATAAMAFKHLQELKNVRSDFKIHLLIGMCAEEGISLSNHKTFQSLMNDEYSDNFICSYIMSKPAVHSKVYCWSTDNRPNSGFIGSANYTQTAFLGAKREAMSLCDPAESRSYFNSLEADSIVCNHSEAEYAIQIYNDNEYARQRIINSDLIENEESLLLLSGLESVRVSLLDRNDNIHERSGLNWGQREGREPNQAYIPLKSEVYNMDFFPDRGIDFTVLTDDGKPFICKRAQDSAKAIHTPHNNSLLGEYFRLRIGLSSGVFITLEDLEDYGRTHVDFYKIDDETYYMDFSV